MVALGNYGKKNALHHCGNYCTDDGAVQVEVVGEVIGLIEVLADNYVGQWWASFEFFFQI